MSAPEAVSAPPRCPPYVVRTPRLLLRCPEPSDAPARKAAFDASGDHLADFFRPGTREHMSLDEHLLHVRRVRGGFDLDQDRGYAMYAPDGGPLLGEAFLLKRAGVGALEVGYWLARDATGHGYATEAAAALTQVAFVFDRVQRVDLYCDPDNEKSAAVARRLGFHLDGTLRDRQLAAHHPRSDLMAWSLLAPEFVTSANATLKVELLDALGRPVGRGV